MSQAVDYLLEKARAHPLLTPAQEIELGRRIRAWQDHPGGPAAAPSRVQRSGKRALERFLTCNLRLAHYVARRYANRGIPLEDLVQAASEGLLTAYRRFDPAKGFRSSSYAVWYARQACQNAIAAHGTGVRLPTSISEALRRVSRVSHRLTGQLGRVPTPEEIEKAAGLKPGQLEQVKAAARCADTRSLSAEVGGHGFRGAHILLGDVIRDEAAEPSERLDRLELIRGVEQLLDDRNLITPQQRYILKERYLSPEPCSLARLASRLNCSRERVRRLERMALDAIARRRPQMRHFLTAS